MILYWIKKILKILYYPSIISILFMIDRVSKDIIVNHKANVNGNVDIYINPFINFILVWNKGVGFGLFSFEQSTIYNSVTLIVILISLIIIYFIIKTKDYRKYFYLIILGGSLGNLFDRIYYSAVPGFIDISYKSYHWFVFNVADIFITLGIIGLLIVEITKKEKISNNV